MDFSQENHVLVVFPHPDDEAFGVSGTIMKYREKKCLSLMHA